MSLNCLNKLTITTIMIAAKQAFGSSDKNGDNQNNWANIIKHAIIVDICVLAPADSAKAVLGNEPLLTNDLKNELIKLDMPKANNSWFEFILYLCFLEKKSAVDIELL